MSLNAAALRIMLDKGLTLADAVEIAEAMDVRADRTGAERQRRHREKKRAERDTVTRDVTRDAGSPYEDTSTPSGTVLPDEASASSPVRQPVSEARDFWNEVAAETGWPQVRDLSAARAKLLAARLRQHGLDGWKAAISRARASPYLGGADPPSWFTFSWLIKAENFLKTIEGNYDRQRATQNLRGSRPSPALDLLKCAAAEEAAESGDQEDYWRAGPSLPAIGTG